MHRRPPRRLPGWVPARAEQRLLALLDAAPANPAGWTPSTADAEAEPPPLRFDPGRRGGLSLLAVVVCVAGLVAVQAYRSRPRVVAPARPAVAATVAAGTVVVDIEGAVRRPGLLTLPRGARVSDAVRAAGGLVGTTVAGINLARLVVDGEQLVVGRPAPGAATSAATDGLLDLNTATSAELDALPGVGPVLAQRIVEWRTAHGQFRDVAQLREVDGIGERKYAELSARVRV
jgi:competence protein ComEA